MPFSTVCKTKILSISSMQVVQTCKVVEAHVQLFLASTLDGGYLVCDIQEKQPPFWRRCWLGTRASPDFFFVRIQFFPLPGFEPRFEIQARSLIHSTGWTVAAYTFPFPSLLSSNKKHKCTKTFKTRGVHMPAARLPRPKNFVQGFVIFVVSQ